MPERPVARRQPLEAPGARRQVVGRSEVAPGVHLLTFAAGPRFLPGLAEIYF